MKYGLQDVMGSIDADDDADDGGGAGDDGVSWQTYGNEPTACNNLAGSVLKC